MKPLEILGIGLCVTLMAGGIVGALAITTEVLDGVLLIHCHDLLK